VTAVPASTLDSELPEWGVGAIQRFRGDLESHDSPFPCTFAFAASQRGNLRFGFVESATDESTWEALPDVLGRYVADAHSIGRITSLVVFFRSSGLQRGLEWYEGRLWAVLRHLRAHDPEPWPSDLPRDPDDPRWEFAFAGEPIFVVCSTPAHRRRCSRRSSEMIITFQPRGVFEGLEAHTRRGDAARRTIRDRLSRYDAVPPSPVLGAYGQPDNREWQQYFLGDTNADSSTKGCPLRVDAPSTTTV